jgi:endonuclease/exonuclease/phosphatase family metal-dependent hydrolase
MRAWLFVVAALMLNACTTLEVPECCPDALEPTNLDSEHIRVSSLNIAHGRGTSFNQMFVSKQSFANNLDAVAELLLRIKPDIAALQEVDAPSRWSGKFNHLDYIRTKTNWREFIHGHHQQGWSSTFGTAIISPHDLQGEHSHSFKPSFPSTTKGFVTATIDWQVADKAITLTVFSVHLDFFRRKVRQAQIDELSDYIRKAEGPVIVAGDFNGEWVNKYSAVRELIEELNLKAFMPEAENLGTYKKTSGKRLDWILISQELGFANYSVDPEKLSDHLAVVADIVYLPTQPGD